jgi:hypothetical protein
MFAIKDTLKRKNTLWEKAFETWFSQDQRTNRQGREDREEKTRILASFACFALKKMTGHRFTMDFKKAMVG